MSSTFLKKNDLLEFKQFSEVTTCRIAKILPDGKVFVELSNKANSLVQARVISNFKIDSSIPLEQHDPVLVVFENRDPSLPIIIDYIIDNIEPEYKVLPYNIENSLSSSKTHYKHQIIEAESEVIICCGESSITLRKDGTIIIKGVKISSRAATTNKIRGGSVSIN